MSESALRAAIKTVMDGIGGIGVVHDYERQSADETQFLELFRDPSSGKILGWEITRRGFRSERCAQRFRITHLFSLKGFCGLQDATGSEKFFNAAIEAVMNKIVSAGITGAETIALPQAIRIEARAIGGVLCHHAVIWLPVSEVIDAASDEAIVDLLRIGLNYFLKPGDDAVDASDQVNF